jgi:hypothetical protein
MANSTCSDALILTFFGTKLHPSAVDSNTDSNSEYSFKETKTFDTNSFQSTVTYSVYLGNCARYLHLRHGSGLIYSGSAQALQIIPNPALKFGPVRTPLEGCYENFK